MGGLQELIGTAGVWLGESRLRDPMMNIEEVSRSLLTVTPVLGGRFVRLDYTWSYQEQPQEGSVLVGWAAANNEATAYWIDSWHMGNQVMVSNGTVEDAGILSVLGSYQAPPGPDWRWRTEIRFDAGDRLRLVMYNISPDGKEMLAVECDYGRTTPSLSAGTASAPTAPDAGGVAR